MKEILICKWPIESYRPEGVGESSKTRSSTKAVNHYAVNGTYIPNASTHGMFYFNTQELIPVS